MKLANSWIHPTEYDGIYPDWAGYSFLDWSSLGYFHEGVDYNKGYGNQDEGDAVYMPANGEMLWLGRNWPGYGTHCYTKHTLSNGDVLVCHFAHLKQSSILYGVGSEIDIGDKIAEVGNTGWNDMYAHLHFELFTWEHWKKHVKPSLDSGSPFWPDPQKGWDKDLISIYYLDPYLYIEYFSESHTGALTPLKEMEIDRDYQKVEKEKYKKQRNELREENKRLKSRIESLESGNIPVKESSKIFAYSLLNSLRRLNNSPDSGDSSSEFLQEDQDNVDTSNQ